jgi:hypothetical protein
MPKHEKKHPVARETKKDVSIKARAKESFIKTQMSLAESDILNRGNHDRKLDHYYKRRYQLLGKDPQTPWPGSSNWRSPVMDSEVNKAKSPLMSVYNAVPIVSFLPLQASAVDKTDAAEETMQWLLKTRMRDFEKNMEILADNTKQNGYGIAKIVYEYKTRIVTETIRKAELDPDLIAQVGEANALNINGIVSDEAFQIELTTEIADRFGLNVNDDVDLIAIEKVMNFILSGKDEVVIKKREVSHDAPYVQAVDPNLFIVETGTFDIQDSERCTEIVFKSDNEMKILASDGYYDRKAVDRILKAADNDEDDERNGDGSRKFGHVLNSALEQAKNDREGLSMSDKKNLFRIHETYCLYDIDGDGIKEKCLLIYHHGTGECLRFMEHPYEHGMWPYVQTRNEENDGRFYSPRGIPEQIDQIDEMVTKNRRAKLNRMDIANSLTFKYRLGSGLNPNNFQWVPGQMMPVHNMNDLEVITIPNIDASFDNEENILQFWIERTLGSTDLALQSRTGSETRTKTEIDAVSSIGQQATTMSVKRWQRDMKRIYHQIWSLWMQYGPEQFIASQSGGELKPLTRHEIQGKFEMEPVGTVGEVSPGQQFARAQQRFQTLLQLQELGALGMLGEETVVDFAAAFKDMMNKDDFMAANRIIRKRTPEEMQQLQAQQQQAEAQAQQQAAIEANQPVNLQDMIADVKQAKKNAPNGGSQRIQL